MNYQPLSNRIVGKMKVKSEKVLPSGIIVPAGAQEQESPYVEVEVVAVGRGYVSQSGNIVPMETKVGDKVILIKVQPFILPSEGNPELAEDERYVVFQESDIFVKKIETNDNTKK